MMRAPARPGGRQLLLCLLAALAFGHVAVAPASAHEIRPTIATLELGGDGRFTVQMSVNLEALIANIGPEHRDSSTSTNAGAYDRLRALPPEALARAYEAFAPIFRQGVVVEDAGGTRATLAPAEVEIPAVGDTGIQRTSLVAFSGRVPEGASILRWRFDADFGPSVIRAKTGAAGEVFYSDYLLGGATSGDIAVGSAAPAQTTVSVFLDYVMIGFEHIVPKGLDHILFVVGLFLLSPRLKPLLWQVTCFTLAHSVTLALGMLGVLQIPPAIVEPLIALSIVYVAVENVWTDRLSRWRPAVIFGFGLLHGLGFAGVLTEIGLKSADFLTGLIAFNVGVELGQLTVIGACFLALGLWFGKRIWYRRFVSIPLSLGIAGIASFWFFERL